MLNLTNKDNSASITNTDRVKELSKLYTTEDTPLPGVKSNEKPFSDAEPSSSAESGIKNTTRDDGRSTVSTQHQNRIPPQSRELTVQPAGSNYRVSFQ